ncbi:MAG: hypothetical protein ABW194_04690 [Novosphingobium sp.]
MQVALLSTLEPSDDDPAAPRALLRLGGRSILQIQLGTVLALGCERVICVADGQPREVLALQHAAERAGAAFHVAGDGQTLARAVRPNDELLVLADGLVADAGEIAGLLGLRDAVAVQPANSGVASGYERIDADLAGGGVLRLSGRMVGRLAELPAEWNPVSALLRIAAQEGVRQVPLPPGLVGGTKWVLVRSDADAHRFEPQWLRLHTVGAGAGGPGRWLAARLVEQLGPALLHAGTRPVTVAIAALILMLFGLGLAWVGFAATGFALLGLAWLIRRAASLLARIDRDALPAARARIRAGTVFNAVLDGSFVAAAMWRFQAEAGAGTMPAVAAFVALVPFGLLRLIPQVFAMRRWARWFEDRLIVAAGLAAASLSEVFGLALVAAGAVLLTVILAAAHDGPGAPRLPTAP